MCVIYIDTPGFYVVCEYWPAGNVEGMNNQFFKDNVLAQVKGKKGDTVESTYLFYLTLFLILWELGFEDICGKKN